MVNSSPFAECCELAIFLEEPLFCKMWFCPYMFYDVDQCCNWSRIVFVGAVATHLLPSLTRAE